MTASSRIRYVATYLYPGIFLPESTDRDIPEPTIEAVIAAAPAETSYFTKDGWYAVQVHEIVEARYVSAVDSTDMWVGQTRVHVHTWIVGEEVRWQDLPDVPENRSLIFNIKHNSPTGVGVRTRRGNWQPLTEKTSVISPDALPHVA